MTQYILMVKISLRLTINCISLLTEARVIVTIRFKAWDLEINNKLFVMKLVTQVLLVKDILEKKFVHVNTWAE